MTWNSAWKFSWGWIWNWKVESVQGARKNSWKKDVTYKAMSINSQASLPKQGGGTKKWTFIILSGQFTFISLLALEDIFFLKRHLWIRDNQNMNYDSSFKLQSQNRTTNSVALLTKNKSHRIINNLDSLTFALIYRGYPIEWVSAVVPDCEHKWVYSQEYLKFPGVFIPIIWQITSAFTVDYSERGIQKKDFCWGFLGRCGVGGRECITPE